MKSLILQLVAAFVALLHTDSDDKTAVANLKAQVADLQSQLANSVSFTPDEQAQITSAANQILATDPPTPQDVAAVVAVPPAPDKSADPLPTTVTDATPDPVQAVVTPPADSGS
jgi:hypothetical protein